MGDFRGDVLRHDLFTLAKPILIQLTRLTRAVQIASYPLTFGSTLISTVKRTALINHADLCPDMIADWSRFRLQSAPYRGLMAQIQGGSDAERDLSRRWRTPGRH